MPNGYPSQAQTAGLSALQGLVQGYIARKEGDQDRESKADALRNAYLIAMGHDQAKLAAADTGAGAKLATANIAAGAKGQGMGRGEASLFRAYFTSQDSNRRSAVHNAFSLHNALVDLYEAYRDAKRGDPRAIILLKEKAAGNPWLRSRVGRVGNDPANILPVFAAAKRAAGIELFRVTTGSAKAPTEEEISSNAAQYPSLETPEPQAAKLFNLTTETQIMPAVTGLKEKLKDNRDPATGKWSSTELEKLSRSLQEDEVRYTKELHQIKGYGTEGMVPYDAPPATAQPATGLGGLLGKVGLGKTPKPAAVPAVPGIGKTLKTASGVSFTQD